jgi:hypothetical protein
MHSRNTYVVLIGQRYRNPGVVFVTIGSAALSDIKKVAKGSLCNSS